jgi:hypothetical protein
MAGAPEGAPRRKDAERNRRRLLAAAREVFRDRGVAATLNDVAHHAGLGVFSKCLSPWRGRAADRGIDDHRSLDERTGQHRESC